jgi:hypothetical protein
MVEGSVIDVSSYKNWLILYVGGEVLSFQGKTETSLSVLIRNFPSSFFFTWLVR